VDRAEAQTNANTTSPPCNAEAAAATAAPVVEAEVAVGELLQQGPLDDAPGRLVLEEVDERVVQPHVVLRRALFLGELVETRVLLVECLHALKERTPLLCQQL